jgi:hypothetical protein
MNYVFILSKSLIKAIWTIIEQFGITIFYALIYSTVNTPQQYI